MSVKLSELLNSETGPLQYWNSAREGVLTSYLHVESANSIPRALSLGWQTLKHTRIELPSCNLS
jgi:hypothetical protein